MQGFEIAVTLKGGTIAEVLQQAQSLIDAEGTVTTIGPTTTGKRGRKAAPVADTDLLADDSDAGEQLELGGDDTETEVDSFLEEPPKETKTKKLTDKDVNTAAMAHAKKHGKPATMKILNGKFKIKSILELKPTQYAEVIKALKV